MRISHRAVTRVVLGVLLVGCVRLASAQEEAPMLGLVAGPTRYSLQERRSASLIALRVASPLVPLGTRHWMLEASMGYEGFQPDTGQRRHFLVSEVQLQVRTGGTSRAQLFAGVGGGLGVRRTDSTTAHPSGTFPMNLMLSAGAGGRLLLAERWGAVGELRIRRMTLFRGWNRELTAGLFVTP